jgi:DNA-binding SARP family transcriptional activator
MPFKKDARPKLKSPVVKAPLMRTRLFPDLESGAAGTWIFAPPGAGKTTLVASYLQARGRKALWFNLDRDDRDLSTFFHFLNLAKDEIIASKVALPAVVKESRIDWIAFARRYIRALLVALPDRTPLVFDNMQLADELLCEVLRVFLMETTEQHPVFFISHASPPPVFVEAIVGQHLTILPADKLRLDEEETAQFAQTIGLSDKGNLDHIRDLAGGWIAGLMLLAGVAPDDKAPKGGGEARYSLEDYVYEKVLAGLPQATREVLEACAFFPEFDADLAARASGDPDAGAIIAALSRDRFFIEQRGGGNRRSYVIHGLLATALRSSISEQGLESRRTAESVAGLQLVDSGRVEAGIALLLQANAFEHASRCISAVARQMISSQREEQLVRWISSLPEAELERQPWLEYWRAIATASFDEGSARSIFDLVYERFHASQDAQGMVLTAAAALAAIESGWQSLDGLQKWSEIISREWKPGLVFAAPELELRAVFGMVLAIDRCRVWWPSIDHYLDRLPALIRSTDDPNLHLQCALVLRYLNRRRDYLRGQALIDYVDQQVDISAAHPFPATRWLYWVSIFESWAARMLHKPELLKVAESRLEKGRALAERYGLAAMSVSIAHARVEAALDAGDVASAKKLLAATESQLMAGMWRLHARHRAEWMRTHLIAGEPDLAMRAWDEAQPFFAQASYQAVTSNYYAELAGVCNIAAGNFGVARHWLLQAIACSSGGARDANIELMMFCEAYAAMKKRDRGMEERIRRFVLDLREWQIFGCGGCIDRQLAELCAAALDHDIEPARVRQLICARRLMPPQGAGRSWPWPVYIEALGAFHVRVWGEPLESEGKTRRRSMEIMKYIVARTPLSKRDKGVRLDKMLEELWPPGEAKDPKGSFDISIHRLRKLLGVDDAIEVGSGMVRLNPALVWCDAFEFEARATQALNSGNELAEVTALYTGALFGREEAYPWSMPAEERFAGLFTQLINRQGEAFEEANQYDAAIDIYERGIMLDPLSEVFYRGLIRCYLAMREPAAALRAYRRCRDVLNIVAGVSPSPATEKLRGQIRSE